MLLSSACASTATGWRPNSSRSSRKTYSSCGSNNSTGFFEFYSSSAGNVGRDYVRISEEDARDSAGRDHEGGAAKKALDEVPKPLHGIAKGKRSYPEGVGPMRQTANRDRHSEIV